MGSLVWFRSDLRVDDHTALAHAVSSNAPVHALFLALPGQWRGHDWAPAKVDFLWRNLAALCAELAARGIALQVEVLPDGADVSAAVVAAARACGAGSVLAHREYGVDELARDDAVARELSATGIGWRCFDDATLLPPGSVLTAQGDPFRVYSPFRRRWLSLVAGEPLSCLPAPPGNDAPLAVTALPACPYPASTVDPALWPAGEDAARARLQEFVSDGLADYHEHRDIPAEPGTSRLSPYLALGVISVRRCLEAAVVANGGEWSGGSRGAETWINELIWREFYLHVLAAFPRVSMNLPFRPQAAKLRWRDDPEALQRWCIGETGFPLVDAAMRQLLQTGWMHNRLRMVTAMFLCKYLLLDWRLGEKYFMQHLIDGDLAANNGGWQWSASTGTDAAPYFRLLSPVRQAQRFDPDGAFVTRFLPELQGLPPKVLLQPGAPELLQRGYPPPMLDLAVARQRALDAFRKAGAAA